MTSLEGNGTQRIRSVDVVILNWNGREHLEECLEALSGQLDPGVPWRVMVVDNGSTDESVRWLRNTWLTGPAEASWRELELIESDDNLGFCAGNNLAVDRSTADAIVFLNNDTRPESDWLAHLVGALQEAPSDVAAVSGKLVDWDGKRVDFVEGIMTFDGHAFQRGYRKPLAWEGPASGSELLFACGGNMIMRRSSFLDSGRFDEQYFAYLEDVDLGWRLWSGGERVLYCGEAVARHRSMASSDQLGNDRRGFLFERNAFLTAFKNYDEEHFRLMMPAVYSTLLARTRTLVAENNRGGSLIRLDPYSSETESGVLNGPSLGGGTGAQPTYWQKWRGWGSREFVRRAWRKARSKLAALVAPPAASVAALPSSEGSPVKSSVDLSDPRAVAQLQALNNILENLTEAAESRRRIQRRRKRSDREIFEKFPLALVPTYPGDEEFFGSSGFRSLLDPSVPIKEWTLRDLMEDE